MFLRGWLDEDKLVMLRLKVVEGLNGKIFDIFIGDEGGLDALSM